MYREDGRYEPIRFNDGFAHPIEPSVERVLPNDEDLCFLENDLSPEQIQLYVKRLHAALRFGWTATLEFLEGYAAAGRVLQDSEVRDSLAAQLAALGGDQREW